MKISVWRLEDSDGIGPYRSRRVPERLSEILAWKARGKHSHPNWDEDSISSQIPFGEPETIYLSGFLTLKLLHDWFGEKNLNKLIKIGFVIKEYEVNSEDVIEGNSGLQLVFKKGVPLNQPFF